MVRATGLAPVSASHSAAVLKTAVFAFHHARTNTSRERGLAAPFRAFVVALEFTSLQFLSGLSVSSAGAFSVLVRSPHLKPACRFVARIVTESQWESVGFCGKVKKQLWESVEFYSGRSPISMPSASASFFRVEA